MYLRSVCQNATLETPFSTCSLQSFYIVFCLIWRLKVNILKLFECMYKYDKWTFVKPSVSTPPNKKRAWSWPAYLEEERATAAPVKLFKEVLFIILCFSLQHVYFSPILTTFFVILSCSINPFLKVGTVLRSAWSWRASTHRIRLCSAFSLLQRWKICCVYLWQEFIVFVVNIHAFSFRSKVTESDCTSTDTQNATTSGPTPTRGTWNQRVGVKRTDTSYCCPKVALPSVI